MLNRLERTVVSTADGPVAQPTITISGMRPEVEANPRDVLDPETLRAAVAAGAFGRRLFTDPVLQQRDWMHRVVQRAGEAQHGLELARARRAALTQAGVVRESYRWISVDDALNRLVP